MSDGEEGKPCCISHAFSRQASRSPSKIAVVHASGAARVFKESCASIDDPDFDEANLFSRCRESLYPPLYSGDEFFSYEDVLSAVNSFSSRIRRVLDGGDDPDLVRPQGYFNGKLMVNNQLAESATGVKFTREQLTDFQSTYQALISDSAVHKEDASEVTHGSPPGNIPQIVGIFIVPSVEYIVSVLSVLRCGEAFLPLDPSWPEDRISSIVSLSKIRLIIKCTSSFCTGDAHYLDKAKWLLDHSGFLILHISMRGSCKEKLESSDLVWPCESRSPRMFCYLMYTSGSTGKPKGVCGTEKGLLNRFLWMQSLFPLYEGDILLFKTSVSFVDHLQEFLSSVLTGTRLIVPPFFEMKGNPLYLLHFLKAHNVSRLTAVPSLMRGLIPAMQGQWGKQVKESLRVLVLSGEVLPVSLWELLHKLLPETSILNFYGSTEVSGDCTYFDCKNMPMILETEDITSVPIGMPISNCDILLDGQTDTPYEGEIYVGGSCLCTGYMLHPSMLSSNQAISLQDHGPFYNRTTENVSHLYFRTGDFARKLQSGDLVFLGRRDRIIKVNGQRVALEEIEIVLSGHPDIVDAAVTFHRGRGEHAYLEAYIVLKRKDERFNLVSQKYVCEELSLSIRSWLVKKLPPSMIPRRYIYMESLPTSSSGKIDYALLTSPTNASKRARDEIDSYQFDSDLLQIIKQAFCDALMVEEIAEFDDFFEMGGNSIAAAHTAHKLGIDMRLLYIYSSPSQLLRVIQDRKMSYDDILNFDPAHEEMLKEHGNILNSDPRTEGDQVSEDSNQMSIQVAVGEQVHSFTQKLDKDLSKALYQGDDYAPVNVKSMKMDSSLCTTSRSTSWISYFSLPAAVSFSRCNKVMCERELEASFVHKTCFSMEVPRNTNGIMHELWKVDLNQCVDASPLIVFKDGVVSLFIGSHSCTFLCINVSSGLVQWEVKLEGRVECSASITGDFSQVVVGCYKGKLYFLDFMSGSISWTFQTGGEVKSQPVVDNCNNIIWCGSHDHNLYAIDYKSHCCIYKISCGGSIYGSPSIDLVCNKLYVASTSGRVTAISMKAKPFCIAWRCELGAPIFGSLSITSPNGNVICCLVNGTVVALDSGGSFIWKAITGGPIFAGPCISSALPSQVLICCRNGGIYSFELKGGKLLWEYNVGDPITSSPYVDENTQLIHCTACSSDRLVCICSCSGSIHVLRVNSNTTKERNQPAGAVMDPVIETDPIVQKFASIDLPGDIFSSPVMIGGRIFVGCRDDNLYCIDAVC